MPVLVIKTASTLALSSAVLACASFAIAKHDHDILRATSTINKLLIARFPTEKATDSPSTL
ncbi:hypothetical protein, partial [Halomonas sp. BC1]|uniref:hypothetical protein n=1 Tax=Halomonas sp. BC1 TaxID=1670448 RepID=UPI001C3801AD